MKGKIKISVLLASIILFTGCASIVSDNMYPVTFNSHPDGATINVRDETGKQMYRGTTPTTVSLLAGDSYFNSKKYIVTVSKTGYEERKTQIKAGLDGWYIGNILFGGLIGILIVDPITGNMWKLPSEKTITLAESEEKVSYKSDRRLTIVTLDQVPEHLQERMIEVN